MASTPLKFDRSSIARAARVVKDGGLVIFPTDTVYGLGCDPANESALDRLFDAKRRESKPIPILCDGIGSAAGLASLSSLAMDLAERYWPGALTIVSPIKARLPYLVHQGTGFVGVRVPDSGLCLELISSCGGMITGTSANLSGKGPARTAGEAWRELGNSVDLVLDGGRLEGAESTVVRVSGEVIEVLRQGAIRVSEKGPK